MLLVFIQREMEASGRTEKMKNIVSLLLKQKEKEDADEEGGEGEDNQTMADQSMVTGSGSPPVSLILTSILSIVDDAEICNLFLKIISCFQIEVRL